MTDITQRLRDPSGAASWAAADALAEEAADTIDNLRTVMVAAAEEIHQHWEAHCDAEGYGPSNLMHRLENGIASQYGYTAGAFADQKAEIDRLRAALRPFAAADLTAPTVRDTFGFDVLRARAALGE